MKKYFSALFIFIFFTMSITCVKADTLLYSYGAESITNTNGFLVSKIDNLQVYYPFIPGHNYRIDIIGAVNPHTFWVGICNDSNVCNPSALNYPNDGDFSINFTDINSQWFDIWGNCAGYGVCSIAGANLYETTPSPTPSLTPTPTPSPSPTPTLPPPTPTPSPTPTPTPIPTPTPTPTATPVTKVVFVPGFGASWNANAILNCQFDSDPSHWSLASYAETTYNPILNAIATSGWNTKPFYYDWRQEVPVNAVSLTNTINGFAEPNEKIDLIGHSMGGLVSRAYLETQSGEKLDSLLTIGSPHKGLSVSYPSWSGGEIWSDNFLAKVATTLLLKRCGGIFSNNRTTVQNLIPSVHNLLPTFNYLHIMKTGILKSTSSMFAKNNWLPTDFPFFGVRVGSLSGVGFSTLINIPVKPPSVRDLLAGNWLDGNPTGKEYSLNGDGTTLAESSIVAGAENKIINQTHAGLVNSVEGMTEILKFLGTPQQAAILNTNQVEPNSALVIIGYPSNFWVSDEKGNFKKDKDGMVAFINPKSGNFRLNLLPQTNKTLFIVAQFLPNGQVFYKEYNLTNLLPKSKTLEFNQDDPQEDILN